MDDSYQLSVDFAMNGTTPVVLSGLRRRAWHLDVLTAGSGGENAGTITVRHTTTTANVFLAVLSGRNSGSAAVFTVPAGKVLYFTRVKVRIVRANGSPGSALYTIRVRRSGEVYQSIRVESVSTETPDAYTFEALGGIKYDSDGIRQGIPAQSDILVRLESINDNNTQASCAIEYVMYDV